MKNELQLGTAARTYKGKTSRSKEAQGRTAEKEIQDTFKAYRRQGIAWGVKVDTQYRVAWIPDKKGVNRGLPVRTMVAIKQNLLDFVGIIIESGQAIMVEVKSTKGTDIPVGNKDDGIKLDQVKLIRDWAMVGALVFVLWKAEETWFRIPPCIIEQALVRKGPLRARDCRDLDLEIPIRDDLDLVDFLAGGPGARNWSGLVLPDYRTPKQLAEAVV